MCCAKSKRRSRVGIENSREDVLRTLCQRYQSGSLSAAAAMAQLASGSDQLVGSGLAFQSLFFVGAVLFLMTMTLNLLAARIVRRFRNEY